MRRQDRLENIIQTICLVRRMWILSKQNCISTSAILSFFTDPLFCIGYGMRDFEHKSSAMNFGTSAVFLGPFYTPFFILKGYLNSRARFPSTVLCCCWKSTSTLSSWRSDTVSFLSTFCTRDCFITSVQFITHPLAIPCLDPPTHVPTCELGARDVTWK